MSFKDIDKNKHWIKKVHYASSGKSTTISEDKQLDITSPPSSSASRNGHYRKSNVLFSSSRASSKTFNEKPPLPKTKSLLKASSASSSRGISEQYKKKKVLFRTSKSDSFQSDGIIDRDSINLVDDLHEQNEIKMQKFDIQQKIIEEMQQLQRRKDQEINLMQLKLQENDQVIKMKNKQIKQLKQSMIENGKNLKIDKLQHRLSKMDHESEGQSFKLQKQIIKNEGELLLKDELIAELKSQNEKLMRSDAAVTQGKQSDIDALKQELGELQDENESLFKTNQDLEKHNAKLTANAHELRLNLRQTEELLQAIESRDYEKIVSLRESDQSHIEQVKTVEHELRVKFKELKQMQDEIDDKKSVIEELAIQITSYQNELQDEGILVKELNMSLTDDKKDANHLLHVDAIQLDKLHKIISENEYEIQKQKDINCELIQKLEESERKRQNEMNTLEETFKNMNAEQERLKDDLEDAQYKKRELLFASNRSAYTGRAEKEKLEEELRYQERMIKELKVRNESQITEIHGLRQTQREKNDKNQKLNQNFAEFQKALQNKRDNLTQEIVDCRQELNDKNTEILRLTQLWVDQKDEADALRQVHQQHVEKIDDLNDELTIKELMLDVKQCEISDLNTQKSQKNDSARKSGEMIQELKARDRAHIIQILGLEQTNRNKSDEIKLLKQKSDLFMEGIQRKEITLKNELCKIGNSTKHLKKRLIETIHKDETIEAEKHKIEKELSTKEEIIKEHLIEINGLKHSLIAFQHEIVTKNEAIHALENAAIQNRQANDKKSHLKDVEIRNLRNDLNDNSLLMNEQRAELMESQNLRIKSLHDENMELKERVHGLEEENKNENEEINELKHHLDENSAQYANERPEDSKIEQFKERNKILLQSNKAQSKRIKLMKKNIEKFQQIMEEKEEKLSIATDKIDNFVKDLKMKLYESEKIKSKNILELKEVKKENDRLTKQVEEYHQEISNDEDQIRRLSQLLCEEEDEYNDLQGLDAIHVERINALNEKLSVKEREICGLSDEKKQLLAQIDEYILENKTKSMRLSELNQLKDAEERENKMMLSTNNQTLNTLDVRMNELQAENMRLMQENESREKRIAGYIRTIHQFQNQKTAMMRDQRSKTKSLQEYMSKNDNFEQRIEEINQNVHDLVNKLEIYQRVIKAKDDELYRMNDIENGSEYERNSIMDELRNGCIQLNELKQTYHSQITHLKTRKDEQIEHLEQLLENSRRSDQAHISQIDDLKMKLIEFDQVNRKSKEEVQRLYGLVDLLHNEVKTAKHAKQGSGEEIEALRISLIEMSAKYEDVMGENDRLIPIIKMTEQERNRLSDIIDEKNREIVKYEAKIQALDNEILHINVNDLTVKKEQMRDLQLEIHELREEEQREKNVIARKDEMIRKYKLEIDARDAEKQNVIRMKEEELSRKDAIIYDLRMALNENLSEYKKLTMGNNHMQLQTDVDGIEGMKILKLNELQSKVSRHREVVRDKDARILQLEQCERQNVHRLDDAKRANQKLMVKLNALNCKLNRFKHIINERDVQVLEKNAKMQRYEEKLGKINQNIKGLMEKDLEIKTLKQRIYGLHAGVANSMGLIANTNEDPRNIEVFGSNNDRSAIITDINGINEQKDKLREKFIRSSEKRATKILKLEQQLISQSSLGSFSVSLRSLRQEHLEHFENFNQRISALNEELRIKYDQLREVNGNAGPLCLQCDNREESSEFSTKCEELVEVIDGQISRMRRRSKRLPQSAVYNKMNELNQFVRESKIKIDMNEKLLN